MLILILINLATRQTTFRGRQKLGKTFDRSNQSRAKNVLTKGLILQRNILNLKSNTVDSNIFKLTTIDSHIQTKLLKQKIEGIIHLSRKKLLLNLILFIRLSLSSDQMVWINNF